MKLKDLKNSLRRLQATHCGNDVAERLAIAGALLDLTSQYLQQLSTELNESGTKTQRRKAKERETATDPKPPVKPVRVAEPTKPKKPKYSGNHAPSARR